MGCRAGAEQSSVDSSAHPPAHVEPPAPSTAVVEVTIESCSNSGGDTTCHLLVKSVVAYGMSTPPLSSSQELIVAVPNRITDTFRVAKEDWILSLTLRYRQQLTQSSYPEDSTSVPEKRVGSDSPPSWIVLSAEQIERTG